MGSRQLVIATLNAVAVSHDAIAGAQVQLDWKGEDGDRVVIITDEPSAAMLIGQLARAFPARRA